MILTVDSNIQYYAYKYLAEAVLGSDAISGTAIVLDNKKGEVLAIASYPSFKIPLILYTISSFSYNNGFMTTLIKDSEKRQEREQERGSATHTPGTRSSATPRTTRWR